MKKSNLILVLGISVFLSGCFEEQPQEEIHTVDWYLKHQDVLIKKVDECMNNPGKLADTPNCKNAIVAYNRR